MPAMLPDMLDSAAMGGGPQDEHTTNLVTSIFTTAFNAGGAKQHSTPPPHCLAALPTLLAAARRPRCVYRTTRPVVGWLQGSLAQCSGRLGYLGSANVS